MHILLAVSVNSSNGDLPNGNISLDICYVSTLISPRLPNLAIACSLSLFLTLSLSRSFTTRAAFLGSREIVYTRQTCHLPCVRFCFVLFCYVVFLLPLLLLLFMCVSIKPQKKVSDFVWPCPTMSRPSPTTRQVSKGSKGSRSHRGS